MIEKFAEKGESFSPVDSSVIEEKGESATEKITKLLVSFGKEYAGLLTQILTQKEVLKLYTENDLNDTNLGEEADQQLKERVLNQTIFEAEKATEYILRRLIKLNIIEDSEDGPHLTDEDQCIIDIWKENGMILTYKEGKLGLMDLDSYIVLFDKEYGGKGLSTEDQTILLKTHMDIHNLKILRQLGFSNGAIDEMMKAWKKNI